MKVLSILFLCGISYAACSQTPADSLYQSGIAFYKKQDFVNAAKAFYKAGQLAENKITKQTDFFYAAITYSLARDSSNALLSLDQSVIQNGFNDLPSLHDEETFGFLKQSKRWKEIVGTVKPVYTMDPNAVKIIDSDVRNFWAAYDKIGRNTDKAFAVQTYKNLYFDKGTLALQSYLLDKVGTIDNFVYIHQHREKYYASIRANTLKAAQLKSRYQQSFVNLRKIYVQAIFPPVYFVIGKLNSGGTICNYGLLIAIDQACMASTADTSELTTWEKNNISSFANLPHTVAHELIHYEQNGMASDTTLLSAALREGMADFIGELISGKTSNERLKVFARGKEKQIWSDFRKEMHLNRSHNWIANADQETADKPADLGYWVGYQICKSYYEESADKKNAIFDMLHIQDYKKFLTDSKFEEKMRE